ncbi:PREDICTED: uncharacterized protein LOC108362927 [Rhagoletis zephyria]|uniref:uncharacterized protein LOC108362927 n=1 Tax=Rhagoletis zephyria TaxID=28612 RepID=UPI000811A303|nr:PREDICTED: uncharacterized protein LOC108362927 [Rhagoletis zephyria]
MAEFLEDDYTVEDEAITGICFEFKLNVYDIFQPNAMFTVDIVKWAVHEHARKKSKNFDAATNDEGEQAQQLAGDIVVDAEHTNIQVDCSTLQRSEQRNDQTSINAAEQTAHTNAHANINAIDFELLVREANLLKRELSGSEIASNTIVTQRTISLDMIQNMIPEFSGGTNVSVWVAQFKNIASGYDIKENELRILMLNKLKGKAQRWLHSISNFTTEELNSLISQMENVFGSKESRLLLRRRFETRQWKAGEKFSQYFNDKEMLASQLQLSEEELVEYVVEGIADDRLRTQAYLQCYTTKEQLVKAFTKIEAGRKTTTTTTTSGAQMRDVRSYNCNSRGHIAPNCDVGACYACGSKDHRVAACTDEKNIHMVDEYNVYMTQEVQSAS